MAFFGSNGLERKVKRTHSTSDRNRRERPAGARAAPNAIQTGSTAPLVDEFGFVVKGGASSSKAVVTPSQQQIQQNAYASASLASSSLNPSDADPDLSTAAGSSMGSQKHIQSSLEKRLSGSSSKSGTRQGPSSNSSKKRTSLTAPKPSSAEGRSGSPSGSDRFLRSRSSPDLKEKQRARPKATPHENSGEKYRPSEEAKVSKTSSLTGSLRGPKGPRPLIRPGSRGSQSVSSSTSAMTSLTKTGMHSTNNSFSLASTAQISEVDEENTPRHQYFDTLPSPSKPSITEPSTTHPSVSSKKSFNTKSTNGNISDGSYGSPLSELGVVGTFTVKSLLARPAASTIPSGVRSEPDIDYGSASSLAVASRRYLRVGASSPIPPHSPSVYSQGSTVDASKPSSVDRHPASSALSDPETSSNAYGSFGRARDLEWGHILSKSKSKDRVQHPSHTRDQSACFSLSSPSEGTLFPYGRSIPRDRNQGALNSSEGRPIIQLTTSAIKRLSALGASEAERASPTHSQNRVRLSPTLVKQDFADGKSKTSRSRPSKSKGAENVSVQRREDSPPPVGLTPSELIMHQYKQQEKRRRELEKGATGDVEQPEKVDKKSTSESKSKSSKKSAAKGNAIDDDGLGPYYTVFGDSSGKVVTIGRSRDSAFGLFDHDNENKAQAIEKAVISEMNTPAPQSSTGFDVSFDGPLSEAEALATATASEDNLPTQKLLRRKLSKKISGTPKDGSMSSKRKGSADEGVFSGSDDGIRPRPSLTLSAAAVKRPDLERITPSSKSPETSLESFVAVPDAGSGKPMPSATNGLVRSGRLNERSASDSLGSDREKGKIWGFVKRISSNTLKDKYRRSSAEIIPPVPALPADTIQIVRENILHSQPRERKKSIKRPGHGRRPSTAPALSDNDGHKEGRFATIRKKPSLAQLAHIVLEPRSSSPSTDNVSSLKFKHLNESSESSLAETKAKPEADAPLIQHILPPETLHMLEEFNAHFSSANKENKDSMPTAPPGKKSDGLFYGHSGSDASSHHALPVPPRRPVQANTPASSRSESPTIPMFSAENAINTFGPGSRNWDRRTTLNSTFTGGDFGTKRMSMAADSQISSPPPRPPRSARRGQSTSIASHPSQSSEGSSQDSYPEPKSGVNDPRASVSAQSASTYRPTNSYQYSSNHYRDESTSTADTPSPPPELLDGISPISASDSASSAVTFRDITSFPIGAKPMLSEKEKDDKWNALLDRSERAGGTLHVGLGGLLSDSIRDSALEPIRDDYSFMDY